MRPLLCILGVHRPFTQWEWPSLVVPSIIAWECNRCGFVWSRYQRDA